MAITTHDDWINACNYQQQKAPTKFGQANGANNAPYYGSSWIQPGSYQASTPTSGSGSVCDGTTHGRIPLNDAGGSRSLILNRLSVTSNLIAGFNLMDRYWHCSGLSGTATTVQSINSVPLPARAGTGDDCELWLEVYTTLGASSRTGTIVYTNSAGVPGRTGTVVIPTTARASAAFRCQLQAGDTGVESVQSIQLNLSTGTTGNFGLVIAKRIASISAEALGATSAVTGLGLGLPEIPNDNCLYIINTSSSTSSTTYDFEIQTVEA